MAHSQLTPQEVDEQAALIAAGAEPAKEEDLTAAPDLPALAFGAEGPDVTKLVNLLDVLGFSSNSVVHGGAPLLDEAVLVDVRAAQAKLDVIEPEIAGVHGELVGPSTWSALYEAVAAELEAKAGQ